MQTTSNVNDPLQLEREKLQLEVTKQNQSQWAKYEDIAMHFNDLTMRLRLQALAGVGAAALIAGGISTHQGQLDERQIGIFLMAMSLIWAGIYLLDVYYYQALLKGAVAAIVDLEKSLPGVDLSTKIEQAVGRGGRWGRRAFYGFAFFLLFFGGLALLIFAPKK